MSDTDQPVTEELQEPTEAPPETPVAKPKKERTEAQRQALEKARGAASKTQTTWGIIPSISC